MVAVHRLQHISIHALREEGDRGSRLTATASSISIHALREEGDAACLTLRQKLVISIHALREEGDFLRCVSKGIPGLFLSTPSARRATRVHVLQLDIRKLFLSTPSARRATELERSVGGHIQISIHALREEGDVLSHCVPLRDKNFYPRPPRGGRPSAGRPAVRLKGFLSTPSARRATPSASRSPQSRSYFYPRPPRGGRPSRRHCGSCGSLFLSTPSARRATAPFLVLRLLSLISIHALREEGDPVPDKESEPVYEISIHALREEGDCLSTE